jgi:predicted transcriptional regulator
MQKVYSGIKPDKYLIRKTDDDSHYVKLRQNIKEITNEETNSKAYQYEELEVIIPKKKNIDEYIQNNFEALLLSNCPEMLYERLTRLENLLTSFKGGI